MRGQAASRRARALTPRGRRVPACVMLRGSLKGELTRVNRRTAYCRDDAGCKCMRIIGFNQYSSDPWNVFHEPAKGCCGNRHSEPGRYQRDARLCGLTVGEHADACTLKEMRNFSVIE
jgi:hypothetical protein